MLLSKAIHTLIHTPMDISTSGAVWGLSIWELGIEPATCQ